jgi:hypothetical protein
MKMIDSFHYDYGFVWHCMFLIAGSSGYTGVHRNGPPTVVEKALPFTRKYQKYVLDSASLSWSTDECRTYCVVCEKLHSMSTCLPGVVFRALAASPSKTQHDTRTKSPKLFGTLHMEHHLRLRCLREASWYKKLKQFSMNKTASKPLKPIIEAIEAYWSHRAIQIGKMMEDVIHEVPPWSHPSVYCMCYVPVLFLVAVCVYRCKICPKMFSLPQTFHQDPPRENRN